MTLLRATKNISFGHLRQEIREGEILELVGSHVSWRGGLHSIPQMQEMISNKWFVPVRVEHELTLVKNPEEKKEPSQEEIPWASPEAKKTDGKPAEANKPHVWEGGSLGWLNAGDGRVCSVCGVTEKTNIIRADRMRANGTQPFHYVDAHGNQLTTLEEMFCPTYIGDPGSAAAVAKEQVRKVKGRVDGVEVRVETIEERLNRLEEENLQLKTQLSEQPVLTVDLLASALAKMLSSPSEAKQLSAVLDVLGEKVKETVVIEEAVEIRKS